MNNPMNYLVPLLYLSLPLMPLLVIYVVGAILSLLRWRRHPTRSRLAFLAFVLFSTRVFASIAKNLLMLRRDDVGLDTLNLGLTLGIIGVFDILVAIVAWILLLTALFARDDGSVPIVAQDCAAKDEGSSEMATRQD